MRFIEIMGGRVMRFEKIRSRKTGFPLSIVISMGRFLKDERFKREVRAGKYFVDFGNDILYAFEIDGKYWHMDVVAQFERDSYLYQRGWRIMRIEAVRIYNNPDAVKREVLKFLYT